MHPFEEYLHTHHLEALTVSEKAGVRYITVYNAVKGHPITLQHAQQIRHAVLLLTGVPFLGNLALKESPAVHDLPTLPMRRFPS